MNNFLRYVIRFLNFAIRNKKRIYMSLTTRNQFAEAESFDSLFKEGYTFKVEVYDFDSPEIKKEIEAAHKEQQAILDRKVVDVDSLNRVCVL